MATGCGDVLSLEDLQIAKKHQLFEAEVITGKQGGVSSGASIDYATNPVTGQIQKTMPAILRDIGFEPASFDFTTGGTLTSNDRNKAVLWPMADGGDGDWYYWEGALPKVIPAASTPASTGGVAEGAWRPVGDITLRGQITDPEGANKYPELQIARWRDEGDVRGWGAVGDGEANDTISLEDAAEERMPNLWRGIYKVDSVSLSHGAYSSEAKILLSGRRDNITKPILSGPLVGNLTLQGEPPVTLNVLSANISSESTFSVEYYAGDFRQAKYQFVDILLSGPVQVGNMLLVRANQPELSGCFEVVGVPATNTARVLMLAQGSLNVSAFTGTAKVLTTVLQFSNITHIDVSDGSLTLINIGILGACYPVANGARSNVYDPRGSTGVSGIVARNGGIVLGVDSGISGISGTQLVGVDSGEIDWTGSFVSCGGRNGISASFGKLTFGSGVASQNLLDNVITQDQSFGFSTGSISAHAGRNGYISSTNSTCNLANSNTQQNGFLDPTNGDGAGASSANLTVIGVTARNNANAGIRGVGGADIRGTGVNVQGNSYGVLTDTTSHALVTGTIDGNTVTDLLARNGGKIEAIGVTHTTSTPPANRTDGTGALVQTTSSIAVFGTSGGLEVAGGGVINKVVRLRVTGVDFPSVPAGSQQSVSVTVPGVIVADDSVVMVQRDSTTDRAGLMYEAVVSADNTVLITANNFSTAAIDPPSENFNLVIFHF